MEGGQGGAETKGPAGEGEGAWLPLPEARKGDALLPGPFFFPPGERGQLEREDVPVSALSLVSSF